MLIDNIDYGNYDKNYFNVIIEVPANSDPVKYEIDKKSGALFVDRFLKTPMFYPCDYGFIPNTLSEDGDPIDVLVLTDYKLLPLSVIKVKPVGVLIMEDEKGMDEKIIAVPHDSLNTIYEDINDISDIDKKILNKISHFFERYKDLDSNKWVKIKDFANKGKARELIKEAIERIDK